MFIVMLDHSAIEHFQSAILDWFRKVARPLPWRLTRDPYHVWLSEVILQQTRVAQGLPYYARILETCPDVQSLAALDESALLRLWEGLGYYSRARNLLKAARIIACTKNGVLPATARDWEQLPGIGRYTANAIASIAFNEPLAVLDGNVKRVLSRLYDIPDCIDLPNVTERLWAMAQDILSRNEPGDFNQAMMELGATVCLPANPVCDRCPVAHFCAAFARGTQGVRPVRSPKSERPNAVMLGLLLWNGKRQVLIARRPSKGMLGGLWEFPVVERPTGAKPPFLEAAQAYLGAGVNAGQYRTEVRQVYTHFSEDVMFCDFHLVPKAQIKNTILSKGYTDCRWVSVKALESFALTKAARRVAHLLGPCP